MPIWHRAIFLRVELEDLALLKTFIAVAEARSFTRGGTARGIGQSVASKHVIRLEADVGVPLVVRKNDGCTLTPDGEALLADAKRIVRTVNDAKKAMAERHRKTGTEALRIAHSPTHREAAMAIVDKMVTDGRFRGLRIRVDEIFRSRIERLVESGRVDLGIVDSWSHSQNLQHERLADAPLRLIINPERTDLKARGRIETLTELEGEAFVLMRRGLNSRKAVQGFFEQGGFSPRIAVEANSVATLLALVRSNPKLVSILPVPAPKRDVLRLLPLLRLPEPVPALGTYVLWRAMPEKQPDKKEARAFRFALRDHVGPFEGNPNEEENG